MTARRGAARGFWGLMETTDGYKLAQFCILSERYANLHKFSQTVEVSVSTQANDRKHI